MNWYDMLGDLVGSDYEGHTFGLNCYNDLMVLSDMLYLRSVLNAEPAEDVSDEGCPVEDGGVSVGGNDISVGGASAGGISVGGRFAGKDRLVDAITDRTNKILGVKTDE